MNKTEQITITNKLFNLFIQDLCNTLNITRYKIGKDLGFNNQFLYNKQSGYSAHFVSLPTLYIICTYYNFTFDLLKYVNQLESSK